MDSKAEQTHRDGLRFSPDSEGAQVQTNSDFLAILAFLAILDLETHR
jgi:hypothetical protein